MKKKTTAKTKKPTDLKPKPPIKKPVKQKLNQKDPTRKELALSAIDGLRKVAIPTLSAKLTAKLQNLDAVILPIELVDHILDILGAAEYDIIRNYGLEEYFSEE
jgi:hypothetical protein